MPASSSYRGRFAPSPTGPLHLGSLIAAVASYLDARHQCGAWLVRMDDLDPPRELPGAADSILRSLEDHGLDWDEEVMWQSRRQVAYLDALATLRNSKRLFDCRCTRAALGPNGSCQGDCRTQQAIGGEATATRIIVAADTDIQFNDGLQGLQHSRLGATVQDFALRRKDQLIAYQLAVVVDDAEQQITDIVRGSDLLDSTPRQIYLQRCLGFAQPHYTHIPVIANEQGQKFSKQNHAPELIAAQAPANLRQALHFLQQAPPPQSAVSPREILSFASQNWGHTALPARMRIPASELPPS